MTQNTISPEDRKRRVSQAFNSIASHYDSLRFVQIAAQRLIELADLQQGARVLDLASGTGLVAIAAAQLVGPSGSVVGVDLSHAMLALAREKLVDTGLGNVAFHEGDAEHLDFPDESFDVVLCASSLFFMPDMQAVMRECRRVLVPGGQMGFSSFGANFLDPVYPMWVERLKQHGILARPLPALPLVDPLVCDQLLREAGFKQVQVISEGLGYMLQSGQDRWGEIEINLEGLDLKRHPPEQQALIKAEHLAELDVLAQGKGIWVHVPVNIAFGRKAATGE